MSSDLPLVADFLLENVHLSMTFFQIKKIKKLFPLVIYSIHFPVLYIDLITKHIENHHIGPGHDDIHNHSQAITSQQYIELCSRTS